METIAASPLAAVSAPVHADYADWLSPMLVKELRQGVRTRVFVFLFILLQLFMLMNLVLSLLVASTGLGASDGTFFFWLMVAVPTLLIIPMSGLNAVGGEIRGNTIELIFLTRLTAFRIVVGKWFALLAQSLLLVCAVLPYLVLRYFMGGINLTSELLLLGAMLVGSALLIAVTTGLSAFPTRVVRPLTVVVSILAFFIGLDVFGGYYMRGRMGFSLPDFVQIGTVLICAVILILLMLDVGAARIAPPAENHSAAMRCLALAGLLTAAGAQAFSRRFEGVTFGAFVVAFIVCAIALCEQPRAIPSIYRPFVRMGWLGRIAGKFFYPGWHTGMLFSLAMFTAFGALLIHEKVLDATGGKLIDDRVVWFVALFGALVMPTALIRGLFRRTDRPAALFFGWQVICLILSICFLICDSALHTSYRDLITFLPLCALLAGPSTGHMETMSRLIAVGATTLVSLIVLLIAGIPAFRLTRRMERESLDLPTPPQKVSEPPPPATSHEPLA